jgi:hypothetical protein
MVVLVTVQERNPRTGIMETIVSHGIDPDTLEITVLPPDRVQDIGARFDRQFDAYVLD